MMKQPITIAVHPWEILKEYIAGLGISQTKFAELIGKKQSEVSYILNGTRDINTDRAKRLSIVFKTRPEFWLWMQQDYDLYLLNQSAKNIEYQQIKERLYQFSFA